jgi:hypothetical protein
MEIHNMSTEDIASTLAIMRMQEASYRSDDYLARRPKSVKHPRVGFTSPVDAACRFKMVEWCFQIADFCKFSREAVAIGMSYLDRYLSTDSGLRALDDRKFFQLASMTCLYTAIKIHEPEAMQPRILVRLSKGTYTEEEITDMELEILNAIQWRMNPPTSLCFLNNFLALLPENAMSTSDRDTVYELAKFQTELAVHEYSLVTVDASTVAFAAMMNALETVAGAGTLEIMTMLAKVSSIDIQSSFVNESKDKLYQVVGGDSLTRPSMTLLAPKSQLSTPSLSRSGSCTCVASLVS